MHFNEVEELAIRIKHLEIEIKMKQSLLNEYGKQILSKINDRKISNQRIEAIAKPAGNHAVAKSASAVASDILNDNRSILPAGFRQ